MAKAPKQRGGKSEKESRNIMIRRDVHFQTGDKIWIKVHPQNSVARNFIAKLTPNRKGPCFSDLFEL